MLSLDDVRWQSLEHAYGPAGNIPPLLRAAASDTLPWHLPESAGYDLWSALCHQGDSYTASFAASPHLIALAPDQLKGRRYDALYLAGCIELARLEERSPTIPLDLRDDYTSAVSEGLVLARTAVAKAWDHDSKLVLEASALAFAGEAMRAREILERDAD